ncbi:MAG: hypothetical protein RI902_939 [Pseudomonadota bacterium]|jgi:uncharacterized alkaline shock family protein YloU
MTNIFTVKLLKNGQLIQQRQVHTGLAESTGAVRIKAQADTVYVLSSETSKKSVSKIATQRIGTDLHMVLDDSTKGKPQLIIEGYFEPNQNSALATMGSEGELVLFSAQSQQPMQATADSNPVLVQTANGADASWWGSPGVQLAMIAGGILAFSAVKSKSSDSAQPSQNTIVAYATGAAQATTPTDATYKEAGYTGVTTSNVGAINSALQRTRTQDSSGIQKVITTYQKLIDKANGNTADTTTNDPTLSDYQALGIVLLNIERASNGNALGLLNDIVKSRNLGDINTVSKLDGFASIADKIMLLAKGDVPSSPLSMAELNSIGLSDVTEGNIAAIRSAIGASTDDGEGVKSVTQLKDIQTAYLKVLAQADGTKGNTVDASKTPTASELQTLGVALGKAGTKDDAQQVNALKLLNDVIDGLNNAAVDTVAEISALATTIDKVMNVAKAANNADAIAVGLMVSELTGLGLSGVTNDNLAQMVEAIRLTQSSDGSKVNTFKQMQSAIDLGVIMQYAESLPSASTGHVAPSLSQYLSAGLTSVDVGTNKAISANNLLAINSAVEAVQANNVNSLDKLQKVVNAYAKLLTLADGVKANTTDVLTPEEYSLLGALTTFDVNTGATGATGTNSYTSKAANDSSSPQKVTALTLLNDVINARVSSQVDSIAEINLMSAAVDKVLDQANGTPTATLKVSDFSLLGIQNVTDANLAQVVANLHTAAGTQTDGQPIDTLAEIQKSVSLAVVQMYADNSSNNSNTTPTLQIYKDLNFSDISWDNALVTAVNTVIDSKSKSDINLSSLEGIVIAFESILAEATNGVNNKNTDPTASIYETVTGSSTHIFSVNNANLPMLDDNALVLMNQIVQHKTPDQLNSLVKVELLAKQVDQLMKLASNTGTITFTDLSSMGFSIPSGWSDYNTPNKINKFSQLVVAGADAGDEINSWEKVQNIINSSAVISA